MYRPANDPSTANDPQIGPQTDPSTGNDPQNVLQTIPWTEMGSLPQIKEMSGLRNLDSYI